MEIAIMETVLQIVAVLFTTLIGVLGAWLTAKIAQTKNLQNISIATGELFQMAQTTVLELQQTVVEELKASHEDGKLTKEEIYTLGDMLVEKTVEKLSANTVKLLQAAEVDISAIIVGAGEAFINRLKE